MRQQVNLLHAMSFGKPAGLPIPTQWMHWGLAGLILLAGVGVYKKGEEISLLKSQKDGLLQKKEFLLQEMGTTETAMEDIMHTLSSTLSERVRWSQLMREVSLIIPEGVWTTRWESVSSQVQQGARKNQRETGEEKTGKQMKIIGEAVSQEQLALFLSTLERSPLLSGSRLAHARREKGEVQFEVVVQLKQEKHP